MADQHEHDQNAIPVTNGMLYERLGRKEHALDVVTDSLRLTQIDLSRALDQLRQTQVQASELLEVDELQALDGVEVAE